MKRYIGLLSLALLASCTTANPEVQQGLADLRAFAVQDLDAAIARANAAKDPGAQYRARCYTTLKKYVPSDSAEGVKPPAGVVDAFEIVAEADIKLQAGGPLLPPEVAADCAYIKDRIEMFVLRNGVRFAPVPGLGAAGGLLK